MNARHLLLAALLPMMGCGSSQQFTALPPTLDRGKVPQRTIEMTAENFRFVPDQVRVKAGTLVTLKIKSIEGTHGFKLGAFGLDEKLEENDTKVIEFFAGEKGEFDFKCSHFCGLDHFGMNGKVVVE